MTTLKIMPREMRLMSERILSLTTLPKGFFLAVTDTVMLSQKLGLGGFAMLEERFEDLRAPDLSRIAVTQENGKSLVLDAGGQHGWFVVPTLLDLLGELVARFGDGQVTVVNALEPAELGVATALGGRTGLTVLHTAGDAQVFSATAQPVTGKVATDDPVLWHLLCNGTPIEADLWWRIYDRAKKALAVDTVVSRRHAGPMIVNEDGTVIGRKDNDDETDISFLAAPGAAAQGESAKP